MKYIIVKLANPTNMKITILLIFITILGCGKNELLYKKLKSENNILKERIIQLEQIDSTKIEAVLDLHKMNVVYRGVNNPITITVPNSIIIEADAPGLRKIKGKNKYIMNPGSGNHVTIDIKTQFNNRKEIIYTRTLRIKDIGRPIGTINNVGHGSQCDQEMSRAELSNGYVGVKIEDFAFDLGFKVKAFKIKFPNIRSINIEGNKIDIGLNEIIENLKENDVVQIFDIKVAIKNGEAYRMKSPAPIAIKIIE